MLTITTDSRLAKTTGALHVQFHTAVLTLLDNHGATALGLRQASLDAYRAALATEGDLVNIRRASDYTLRLEELDAERDQLLDQLFYRLEGARFAKAGTPAAEAAPAIQRQILDLYTRAIKTADYQTESAKVDGLLIDLAKLDEDALKALGVDTLMKELGKVNERFTQAYLARNAERTGLAGQTLEQQRPLTDAAYQALADQLTVAAALDPDTPGFESLRELIAARQTLAQRTLTELNQHIAYFRQHYLGAKSATGSATGEVGADTAEAEEGARPEADGSTATDKTPTDVTEVTD